MNQTISGLACGKPIRGHVAFLGGPLHCLSELKAAFIRTLNLDDEHIIDVDNSHLFAAIGSALNAKEEVCISLSDMVKKLSSDIKMEFEVEQMCIRDRYKLIHILQLAIDIIYRSHAAWDC